MANSDISGQITDSSGNPIASAKVYLWREDLAGGGGVVASTAADSNGNFSFTGHPDGSGASESWHVAAEDPNASVLLESSYGVSASLPSSVNSQFDMSITDTSPSPVKTGQTLSVDASLTNSGTDSDTQTITLDINNGVGQVDSSLEAAQGGASKTVPLSWNVPSGQTAQDYQATVASDDDSASQTVTVQEFAGSAVFVWNCENRNGDTAVVNDRLSNGYDGTVTNATYNATGGNDGNGAYQGDCDINVGVSGMSTANSFSGWVYAPWSSGSENQIVWDYEGGGTGRSFSLHYNNNANSGGYELLVNNTSISTNVTTTRTYTHFVATYDGSGTAKIYVNGTVENSSSGRSDPPSSGTLYISKAPAEGKDNNLRLAEFRQYSKELTSTEVSNLYNTGNI